MTDDEHKALNEMVKAELEPVRELAERMLTVLEQVMKRLEVVELKQQHQLPSREA